MKQYKLYNTCLLTGLLLMMGCSKTPTDYREYLNGEELVYPGKVANARALPGNGRVQLIWQPSPDQSITQYRVFWNNGADSINIPATTHGTSDTVRCTIADLSEYVYSFMIYSYDAKGNRSVSTEINNARVYGSVYIATLNNRLTNPDNPYTVNDDNSVTLRFVAPDTINIRTILKYTNQNNQETHVSLNAAADELTLTDYKFGTPVLYQSSYIPVSNALDTFEVPRYDTFPSIYRLVACDKSLFREHDMWGDMGIFQSDTRVSKLWDGSVGPQGYPNIFHSDGGGNLPRVLSFDMGKVYSNLGVLEETGRDCCNNPDRFEVWGIADLTDAIPEMSPDDGGWKAAMESKGWTLLKEVIRTDNGNNAYKTNLIDNPPPVRYIRIRVLHNANGENSYVNMSEITFWNKE
ncbi:DUF4998 domain-containing protein [Chitinophaga rhizophila]|uniref:DUF5000 domain-containing protein n=1 Tax=Chitinophaga rhizophila TaxID=2866212 RepID=A0ABS7GD12_9BACT|nr:DUF4998 domain-containing protein [Chitinophaga rhizophila]MBW8685311.1 hypothetical protein [Chitinophaga rhizophila]